MKDTFYSPMVTHIEGDNYVFKGRQAEIYFTKNASMEITVKVNNNEVTFTGQDVIDFVAELVRDKKIRTLLEVDSDTLLDT